MIIIIIINNTFAYLNSEESLFFSLTRVVLLAIHSKNFGNTTDSGRLLFKRLEVIPVTLELILQL